MDTTIFSAIIALLGVIVSVIISFLSNKKMLKTELRKLEVTIEQNYATKLIEKRLDFYPSTYEIISNMRKKINRVKNNILNEKITLKEIIGFRETYDNVNSKYSLVFSSESRDISSDLRTILLNIIIKYQDKGEEIIITVDDLGEVRDKIGELEFSLKKDLGIYIVEFQDAKRELMLKRYDDARGIRKEREKNLNN